MEQMEHPMVLFRCYACITQPQGTSIRRDVVKGLLQSIWNHGTLIFSIFSKNNTFSYFLTLNEFRERLKQEHPEIEPSWIKLTTITMISQFKRGINIQFLKTFFEEYELKLSRKEKKTRKFIWRMKDTTFYNQISLVYEDYHSTKSIKVFPNGSIQVAGCADLFDCKRVIFRRVRTTIQVMHGR